jgi:hypothetical protein
LTGHTLGLSLCDGDATLGQLVVPAALVMDAWIGTLVKFFDPAVFEQPR